MKTSLQIYREGEFNYLDVYSLENKDQVFVISDTRDLANPKYYYLHIKNINEKDEKIIADCELTAEESTELTASEDKVKAFKKIEKIKKVK